ncbi:MAG: lysine transporter LysE [Capsulimonas sp.]|jgi:threonine/homoserine/homoserine lactone efflux protein|nr:lysine transporter LysE [Capsulimonas sp.]
MHIFTIVQFVSFLAASLICVVAPGPDNLGVLSLGLSRGRKAGIGFAAGCALGCLTHTTWASLGLTALVAASPAAFNAMKFAGAAYLCYLGVKALRSKGASLDSKEAPAGDARQFLTRGFVSNALNPKVALFFLAFLPQFVNPRGPVGLQMLLLGVCFGVMTLAVFSLVGYFSGAIGAWLRRRPFFSQWLDRATGCLFIGLGVRLALAKQRM